MALVILPAIRTKEIARLKRQLRDAEGNDRSIKKSIGILSK